MECEYDVICYRRDKKSFELKQVKFCYIDVNAPTLSQSEHRILAFIMSTVNKITTDYQHGELLVLQLIFTGEFAKLSEELSSEQRLKLAHAFLHRDFKVRNPVQKKYYIHISPGKKGYLNYNKKCIERPFSLNNRYSSQTFQTQFTMSQIEELQQREKWKCWNLKEYLEEMKGDEDTVSFYCLGLEKVSQEGLDDED